MIAEAGYIMNATGPRQNPRKGEIKWLKEQVIHRKRKCSVQGVSKKLHDSHHIGRRVVAWQYGCR
jgi:hypothetical protein